MEKITDGISRVVAQRKPVVQDFDGNDALLRDQAGLRQQVRKFAIAALPLAVRQAVRIMEKGSNKDALQAAKFIKSIADGKHMQEKVIDGVVKRFTDAELNTQLEGTDE